MVHGGNYSFKVVIDEAYSNSDITVKVNGNKLSDIDWIYNIVNISEEQSINVYNVIKNMYDVAWSDVIGTTISVKDGAFNIANGSKIEHGKTTIVIANNTLGYTVEGVIINGVKMGNGVSYTVTSEINMFAIESYR